MFWLRCRVHRSPPHAEACAAMSVQAKDNGHELVPVRGGARPGSFRVSRPCPPAEHP